MSDLNDPQSGPEFSSLEDLMVPPGGNGYGPLKLREDVTTRMMYPSSSDGLHEGKPLPRFLGPGYKQKYDWGKVHDTVDSLYQTLPQVPYTDEYTEKKAKPLASFRDWLDRAPEHVSAGYKGLASLGLGEAQAGGAGEGEVMDAVISPRGGQEGARSNPDTYTQKIYDLRDWLSENVGAFRDATKYAKQAREEAKQRFSADELHNGLGDAYRHARWHELMARDYGKTIALGMGALHELENLVEQYDRHGLKGLQFDEMYMDLRNNKEGALRQDANASLGEGKLITLDKSSGKFTGKDY